VSVRKEEKGRSGFPLSVGVLEAEGDEDGGVDGGAFTGVGGVIEEEGAVGVAEGGKNGVGSGRSGSTVVLRELESERVENRAEGPSR
jgi:hypothetical protein